MPMEKIIIQITSGRGPVECCRVVARVQELMLAQARKSGIETEVLDNVKGDLRGTLLSATILAKGAKLESFVREWRGGRQNVNPRDLMGVLQSMKCVL